MNINLTCSGCLHAQKNNDDLTGRSLLCFRRPPSVYPMMGPNGSVGAVSMRPQVMMGDFACGDYESARSSELS